MYQSGHGAGASCDFLPGEPISLAEVLNSQGYRTAAFFGNQWAAITGKGFKEISLVKKVDAENPDKGSLHRSRMVIDWLDKNYNGEEPFFMFVQFMEPHLPCWPPQPFRGKFLPEDISEEEVKKVNQEPNLVRTKKVQMSPRDWAILRWLYDGETATLDHRMGLIFDYLPEQGIIDETLLIVTADHGANLYSSCCTPVGGGIFLTLWATDMKAEFTGWEHSVKIYLQGDEQITIPGEPNIFALEDRAFIESVKAGENRGVLATYEDGPKATAIACAANESMETGRVVEL